MQYNNNYRKYKGYKNKQAYNTSYITTQDINIVYRNSHERR